MTDAGRAEAFAFDQNLEDRAFGLPGQLRRASGQLLNRLLLAGYAQVGDDVLRADHLSEFHSNTPVRLAYRAGERAGADFMVTLDTLAV